MLSTAKFTPKHDPPFHQAPKQQTKLQNAFSSLARSSLEFYLAHPFSPRICFHHTLSKTSEKSTCTDDSLRRSRYLYVYVCVPANVYFNVLIYICMNVLMCISSNIQCAFLRKCPFSSCATVFLARGSRTTTFLACDSSLVRAHLRLRSCASVFAKLALFCTFRGRSLRRSQRESCGELCLRTKFCLRNSYAAAHLQTQKAATAQNNSFTNSHERSRKRGRSRKRRCALGRVQSSSTAKRSISPSLADRNGGRTKCARLFFFGLASLGQKRKKQLSKTAAKSP